MGHSRLIPYLIAAQFQESIFPPTTRPKILALFSVICRRYLVLKWKEMQPHYYG
jgi:hypothetical protein